MCILLVSISSAQAIECQTNAQSGGYWAWRLIDGRKCWYKGESGMDKALLHWPATDPEKLEVTLNKPKEERLQAIPEVRPVPPEILKMLPIMPPQPSFEDRWRLH